jgi:hypothetical protein
MDNTKCFILADIVRRVLRENHVNFTPSCQRCRPTTFRDEIGLGAGETNQYTYSKQGTTLFTAASTSDRVGART